MAANKVSLRDLQQAKEQNRKIVGVVAWDYQIARIVDRAARRPTRDRRRAHTSGRCSSAWAS